MKTITGYLAILLGALGCLVTLAIVGLVWWGASLLAPPTQQAIVRVDQGLVQIEEALDVLSRQFDSTAKSVEAVRASPASAARERPNTQVAKAESERLRAELLPLIERADATHEVLTPIAQTIGDTAGLAEQAGNKARADRLRMIAGSVREAGKQLDSVRDRSAAIGRGESTPTAKELEILAQQTRKSLDLLMSAVSELKHESERVRKELPETQRTLDLWKNTGAAIITAVLLWIGLGQLAIIGWGRRRLAARTVTAPQPPTSPK